ncbi:uncharacterized protein LOC123885440 [Trifolium pratense]|uniref:uncharacterized protein LOC123885440 n=1 Tax=Trifolium pratense TaxID=57577 RepID=UPI001E6905A7|nr:uncharacterized protein LOC123885440 [Trifolium pratense]
MMWILSLVMLLLVLILSSLTGRQVVVMGDHDHDSTAKANSLDSILQEYAYRALVKPKTGTIYNATTQLPSNFTGVTLAALRLRSGSLTRYGVPNYNEFQIPKGLVQTPYVKRLVLVYQNLGNNNNWSSNYYPLPPNHTYVAPLLGLVAYNGSDLSATNLSHLSLNASGDPIIVRFRDVKSPPPGTLPKCVCFDLFGSSHFTNVTGGNTCSTFQQGHFSIVIHSTLPPPPITISPLPSPQKESKSSSNKKKVWIIVGSVLLGGFASLTLLSLLVLWVLRCKQTKKIQEMERAADSGEALRMTSVGNTKAPTASHTRTLPTIENEYTP